METESMMRAWMYATVAGVTYGVGECLVVLTAGKVDLRRPQTMLDLAPMIRAAMPWLLVTASKKVAEKVVVVYETVSFRHNMNVDRM